MGDLTFLEVQTVEEANRVDLRIYRFVSLDKVRGYVFVKRAKV